MPTRGGSVCTDAAFRGPASALAPEGATTIEIADETAAVRLVIESAGAPRTLSPAESSLDQLVAGETLRLAWAPASDRLDSVVHTAVLSPQAQSALGVALPASIEEAALALEVPSDTPAGPYRLQVVHSGQANILECVGVGDCEQLVSARLDAPALVSDE